MASEPVSIAILFADRIVTEDNGKKVIVGTFTQMNLPQFPIQVGPWAIYVALTNLKGPHDFAITLEHIKSKMVILPINGTVDVNREKDIAELVFNIPGVVFPSEGEYNLSVNIDGELLSSRVLEVFKVSQTTGQ